MNIKSVRIKNKNNRGHIRSHRARFADLYADGLTAKDAEAALQTKLSNRCDHAASKPTIIVSSGHVCLIVQALEGYEQHHCWPDGHVSESMGYTREEAESSARLSIAQTVWTKEGDPVPEVLNTDQLRREFADWVAFQVSYRAARERGLDANDAHKEACLARAS